MEEVILVDELDNEQGRMDKMAAHEKGLLHRAFSVFLFDSKGEMMLQRRALEKYHCGGLWTNAVCSHPQPGEEIEKAIARKLQQELGISTPVKFAFSILYKAEVDKGLIEHEFDHVYIGTYHGKVAINEAEVEELKYLHTESIAMDINRNPALYTPWFRIIFPRVIKFLE